jgi:uncharacterized membrane protein
MYGDVGRPGGFGLALKTFRSVRAHLNRDCMGVGIFKDLDQDPIISSFFGTYGTYRDIHRVGMSSILSFLI